MQDNFENNNFREDEEYSYPKKASIPIKFSDSSEDFSENEDNKEINIDIQEPPKNNTKTFLTISMWKYALEKE